MDDYYRLAPNMHKLYSLNDYEDILLRIKTFKSIIADIISRHPNNKNIQDNLTEIWNKDIIEFYKIKELYDEESVSSLYKVLPTELVLHIKAFM